MHSASPPIGPHSSQVQYYYAERHASATRRHQQEVGVRTDKSRRKATTTVSKQLPQFRNGQVPIGEPKAADYDVEVSRLINRAIKRWEAQIMTIAAFPDQDAQLLWARECWSAVCKNVGKEYELTDRMVGLVCFAFLLLGQWTDIL